MIKRTYKDGKIIECEVVDGTRVISQHIRKANEFEMSVHYQKELGVWDLPVKRSWVNLPPKMMAEISQYVKSQEENFLNSFQNRGL
jgi:hypothetical protein